MGGGFEQRMRKGREDKQKKLHWFGVRVRGTGRGAGFWSQVFRSGSPQESKSCVWR